LGSFFLFDSLCAIIILVKINMYKFLEDSAVPFIIKWGIIGLILGIIMVIISLIIERVKDNKNNKI